MSPLVALGVGMIGGLGAVARFLAARAIDGRTRSAFPHGVLVVNLSGALGLGLVAGVALHGETLRLVGTGFLGAYTTFSTWVFESHALSAQRRRGMAAINVLGSLGAGLLAVWLGRQLGGVL